MKQFNIGIDLGSRMAKIVLLKKRKILYSNVADTGVNPRETAKKLLNEALQENNLNNNDINQIFSTGYGRNIVPFSIKRISEISCHARGVNYFSLKQEQ